MFLTTDLVTLYRVSHHRFSHNVSCFSPQIQSQCIVFLTTDLVTVDHLSHHRFSHDGRFLAVGSEEGCVDFYDLSKGSSLHRADYCKGITGFVAAIDFSVDDKYIRVSTGRDR